MIEIICENENVNDDSQGKLRTGIKYPKNVKQIGEPPEKRRVYIEDYVYTYITSMAYGQEGQAERSSSCAYGVMLGEVQKYSQEMCIFIRGAVSVPVADDKQNTIDENSAGGYEITNNYDGGFGFTQEIWTSLYDAIEKYFKGQEIIGWFACINGKEVVVDSENTVLAPWLQKLHFDNFAGAGKTFLLVDTSAREEHFYLVENGHLTRQSGFMCFYERNENMQEYMLATRPVKSVDDKVNEDVVQNFRTLIQERKEEVTKRQSISLLYGVCAFMVVVVTVIGINMMNSYEKMQTLDDSMNRIAKEIANMNAGAENFTQADEAKGNTPVTRIDGNVYPTEEIKQAGNTGAATNQASMPASQTVQAANAQVESKEQSTSQQAAAQNTPADTAAQNTPTAATEAAVIIHKTYVVKKGDTLMSICKNEYGDSQKYKDVMEINNITNADWIYIGQEIKLP